MFLAAVLNAYLQPAEAGDSRPVIELGASEFVEAPEGLVLAKARVTPQQGEHTAGAPSGVRNQRARW